MTKEEFGQQIKAKYPQYKDVDNVQLADKVLEKYPIYKYTSKIESDSSSTTTPEKTKEAGIKGIPGSAVGIAKGVVSTLKGASELGEKGMQAGLRAVLPKGAEKSLGIPDQTGVQQLEQMFPEQAAALKPKGVAENIGFYGEQAAEFLLPGGAASKVTKAEKLATIPGKLGSLSRLGAQALAEAGVAGGQTAIQQGEAGKEAGINAVFGAAFPIAGKLISNGTKSVPESAWRAILKRTPTQVAKNPNLPAQAAETGIVGKSLSDISAKAGEAIQQVEVQLDDILAGAGNRKIKTSSIINHLEGLKEAYAKVPGEEKALEILDRLGTSLVTKYGESVNPKQANELKRDIYRLIDNSYGKGLLQTPIKTGGQKELARALKTEIEKVAPEVKSLNQKQAVYIQMKKAIERQLTQGEGKGAIPILGNIGMYDLMLGGAGAVGGSMLGSPAYGLGVIAAKKAAQSPAFLSSLAKFSEYFNQASPTKKLMIYNALKGITVQSANSLNGTSK